MSEFLTSYDLFLAFGSQILDGDDTYDICRFSSGAKVLEVALFPLTRDISVMLFVDDILTAKIFVDQIGTISLDTTTNILFGTAKDAKFSLHLGNELALEFTRLSAN